MAATGDRLEAIEVQERVGRVLGAREGMGRGSDICLCDNALNFGLKDLSWKSFAAFSLSSQSPLHYTAMYTVQCTLDTWARTITVLSLPLPCDRRVLHRGVRKDLRLLF